MNQKSTDWNFLIQKIEEMEILILKQHVMKDPVLSTEEVMKLLKVSRRTLQNWRDEGLIEYSCIKGKLYYRLSSIEKMLNRHLLKAA